MYMDLAKVPFQWNIRFVFRDLSSWKAEPFLHETGRFCEIWWNLFKIPKSVWQSPASVLWPDFPVYIASVRGPDLIMWSETVLVKLLNHHFFFFFFWLIGRSSLSWAVFQFCDTIYSQTPHQWLSVSLFYSIIYCQKRYPCSTLTISVETQTYVNRMTLSETLGFSKSLGGILVMRDNKSRKGYVPITHENVVWFWGSVNQ